MSRSSFRDRQCWTRLLLQLKGYPFASSGSESVSARQLVCRILESLREVGWETTATVDVSRKMTDKSVFLFRRCESANLRFACLALSDVDRMRLLNFPVDMAKHIRGLVEKAYMPGISEEYARDASCHEIDLCGVPWTQNSSYSLHARSMLLRLLREAHTHGWRLAASADVSAKYVHQENGPDYPADVHSWFFSYQVKKASILCANYSRPCVFIIIHSTGHEQFLTSLSWSSGPSGQVRNPLGGLRRAQSVRPGVQLSANFMIMT